MSEAKHQGGCHCGAVRYEVTVDLAKPVIGCNCSMCGRSGTLLAFVPATQFTLASGDDHLKSYKFNRHAIDHVFCDTCGIKSFARGSMPDGTATVAVNARCLDGVDVSKLTVKAYDGASA